MYTITIIASGTCCALPSEQVIKLSQLPVKQLQCLSVYYKKISCETKVK